MNVDRAPAPDAAGSHEVRQILGGISRTRLAQIQKEHPDFPAYRELEIGRVWDRAAVKAWQLARTRPRRKAIYVLRMVYGRTGNLAGAARSAGVSVSTARRWMRELHE